MEQDVETPIETLFEKVDDYSRTTVELVKLNIIGKVADVFSSLASQTVVFIVVSMFVLTLNIAVGLWVGGILGKTYLGFLMLAGFYGIVSLMALVLRPRWIKEPINNSLIRQMMKELNG